MRPFNITLPMTHDLAWEWVERYANSPEMGLCFAIDKIKYVLDCAGLNFNEDSWLDIFGVMLESREEGWKILNDARELAVAASTGEYVDSRILFDLTQEQVRT
jgi:hypothetical protein